MVSGIVDNSQGKARPTSSWPRPRSFRGRKTATVLRLATRFGQLRLLAGCAATCCPIPSTVSWTGGYYCRDTQDVTVLAAALLGDPPVLHNQW
jgi:hypothetical protein